MIEGYDRYVYDYDVEIRKLHRVGVWESDACLQTGKLRSIMTDV